MISFIDRFDELSLLENSWARDGAEFVVLYGRRRIGKTRLILEFMGGKKGIFFIAEDTSSKVQITELKDKIARYFEDDFLRRTEIKEWRDLFEYLTKILPMEERFYFIIDEFSYILKNDPSVVSALQKFWDTFLGKTRAFFFVSGSLFDMMSEKVLSSSSPLYGRRTRDLLLTPLWFKDSLGFLNMPFVEKMKVYMGIGGVPEYLLRAREYKESGSFFKKEFLNKNGYFYREPYFLLSQEFKAIRTYFTILSAIAYGNTRPTEIANFSGIVSRRIYPYLENLIRLGFIERLTSITGGRRAGIYLIKDIFFDFWFNFVYENRESIERGTFKAEENRINTFFGKRFEDLIREQIASKISGFPHIGRWWYKDKEIDIVGLDATNNRILFGECKWSEDVDAKKIYYQLKERKENLNWNKADRNEEYIIFARSFKKEFKKRNLKCIDLKKIKEMLSRDR